MINVLKSSGCFLEPHINKILEINGITCLRSLSLIRENEIAAMELDMRSIYADRNFFDKLDDYEKGLYFGPHFKCHPEKFKFMVGDKVILKFAAAEAEKMFLQPLEDRKTRKRRRIEDEGNSLQVNIHVESFCNHELLFVLH